MGVEYVHYLLSADPAFEPTSDQINSSIQLLAKHGAWGSEQEAFKIDKDGLVTKNNKTITKNADGYITSKGDIQGHRIASLMGPSMFKGEIPDSDRYINEIMIIFGPTPKLHESGEQIFIDSSMTSTVRCSQKDHSFSIPFEALIEEKDKNIKNIKVNLDPENCPKNPGFRGWWKFAIRIDCGKDIPEWAKKMQMSNKILIKELKIILKKDIVEIGNYY